MLMDIQVKIPQEEILKASDEFNKFKCLRKEVNFSLMDGSWRANFTCGAYGNGYGVGFSCKDECPLRITDLSKCKEVKTEFGSYLVQDR